MAFPASWSDWTESSEYGPRPVPLASRGGDVYFIIHHAVNTRVQDTIALSKAGGPQVSMTWAIGPSASGVTSPVYCVAVVPEDYRPFTTASSLDGAAVTVEVSNIDLSATYPVAQEAKEWLAQIAAYMHTTYGMPLNRTYILSHQEVYSRGYGSYATACPGPDLQASLDWIVSRAQAIVSGVSPEEEEEGTMQYIWTKEIGTQYALLDNSIKDGAWVSKDPADATQMSWLTWSKATQGAPLLVNATMWLEKIKAAKRVYDMRATVAASVDAKALAAELAPYMKGASKAEVDAAADRVIASTPRTFIASK